MKLTVVAPTYNEAQNVGPFVAEATKALQGLDYEILIADDDSPDRTWEKAEEVGRANPRVRVLRRMKDRGLSPAVIEGFLAARGEILACMDADLQHDATILPAMLRELENGADVVVGSRYVAQGSVGDWGMARRLGSRLATGIATFLLGAELRDPMSGFFMLRRADFVAVQPRLNVRGFKILLEIVARLRPERIVEVLFTFRQRVAGETKMSTGVVLDYFQQLLHLLAARFSNSAPDTSDSRKS